MLTYQAKIEFIDRTHNQAVIRVQSNRCFYSVALTKEDRVMVIGPGVEEIHERSDFPQGMSFEGIALCAVIQFEEGE